MTSREAFEAAAREIYEAWGYHYEGRTYSPRGPYGDWEKAVRSAERVLALPFLFLQLTASDAISALHDSPAGRCCGNGSFGDGHECEKSNGASPLPTSQDEMIKIVAEVEMKMTGMRDATCVALRSGQVRALIADWRKRGEALETFAAIALKGAAK